jgi:hypothetical protein
MDRFNVEARSSVQHFTEGAIVLSGFLDPVLMLRTQRFEILFAVGRLDYDNAAFAELGLLCFG